ncbi:MAG TPA: SRPBCC family protein [Nocardioidaceae bacterium]|nr:SRPBCC family protein [Nocardioidaceae bacterium]
MRAVLRLEVEVAAPAKLVWDYVTDWPRQGEWIPLTRMETVGPARGTGGRIRGWTGLGPVGFWDTMTITSWRESPDGSARCEVLHTGAVVRGNGQFAVVAHGEHGEHGEERCTFVWGEQLVIPAGPIGAALRSGRSPAR